MNMARMQAAAKQIRRSENARRQGANLFNAEIARHEQIVREHANVVRNLKVLRRMAMTPPAKLITKLDPPEGHRTVAVFDSEDVAFYYMDGEDENLIEIPWPFDNQYVYQDDCEAAGIEVVIA